MHNLAKNLTHLMAKNKVGIIDLSNELDMPAITIKKLKYDQNTNPSIEIVDKIAGFFNITIDELIKGDTPN